MTVPGILFIFQSIEFIVFRKSQRNDSSDDDKSQEDEDKRREEEAQRKKKQEEAERIERQREVAKVQSEDTPAEAEQPQGKGARTIAVPENEPFRQLRRKWPRSKNW